MMLRISKKKLHVFPLTAMRLPKSLKTTSSTLPAVDSELIIVAQVQAKAIATRSTAAFRPDSMTLITSFTSTSCDRCSRWFHSKKNGITFTRNRHVGITDSANSHDQKSRINFVFFSISSSASRFKNGTRRSCTFTNEEMRQIERENRILLNKILAQRPRHSSARRQQVTADYQVTCLFCLFSSMQFVVKLKFIVYYCRQTRSSSASRVSSAAINRRQQQQRIDFDNNILRKKIERIARRSAKQ